jgi:hypothetical protein
MPSSGKIQKTDIEDTEGVTPVCHSYKHDDVIGSDGTVCRIIIRPDIRALEVGMGTGGEYVTYSL